MDQEGHAPANKRRKIEEDKITRVSIVRNGDDKTVSKSVCLPVVDLIDDTWLLVFDYLGIEDKTRIARVCRRWRDLAQISWKSITRVSFKNLFKPPSERVLTDNLLEVLLGKCGTRVQYLNLFSGLHLLTPRALDVVGRYCTSLQELNLSKVHLTNALKTLAEKLPRLRTLTLIDSCHGLEEYKLGEALKILQSLKTLNVSGNYWITGEFFSQAPQSLTEVFAESCCHLTNRGVRFLANKCPNLEVIDINRCSVPAIQYIKDFAENCPKLKRCLFEILCYDTLTSDYLPLCNLPLLEEIELSVHYNVKDEVFHELGTHCPLLRSVSCRVCCNITDAAIEHLSPCQHLESIDLSYCYGITGNAVIQLSSAHPALKKVYLAGCRFLTDDKVSCLLSSHPNLQELDISKCQEVTDSLLPILESSLQRREHAQPLKINLEGTSITERKLSSLQKRLNVIFKGH